MIVGEAIAAVAVPIYSPTFARGGLSATFLCEVFAISAGNVDIYVETKNVEDTSWIFVTSFSAITTPGLKSCSGINLKEQLRFVCNFIAFSPGDAIYFNMAAPVWSPY